MLFAIALGGAAGTVARWVLGGLAQRAAADFPYGTLVINVSGSFLLGFLLRYLLTTSAPPELRAALTVGFCGGYTTFSTFSYETAVLLEGGSWGRAATYAAGSVLLSLAATFAGFAAARAAVAAPH